MKFWGGYNVWIRKKINVKFILFHMLAGIFFSYFTIVFFTKNLKMSKS